MKLNVKEKRGQNDTMYSISQIAVTNSLYKNKNRLCNGEI